MWIIIYFIYERAFYFALLENTYNFFIMLR